MLCYNDMHFRQLNFGTILRFDATVLTWRLFCFVDY